MRDDDETKSLGNDPAAAPPELARILERYMAEVEAGEEPDRDRLVAEHPEHAESLRECLSAIDFIHGASRKIDGPLGPGTGVRLGDFRIVREIGSGGMGVVYEAEQISLGRRVALKVLRIGPSNDPEAMRRFQREAETVAQLHHTNIVPVHAVGEERGIHYFAMQFIEGQSVAEAARSSEATGRELEPSVVAAWGLAAAEALAHAHARGVIHRDVKPSNLLLDRDGRVWLTDFGLARRQDDVTLSLTGMVLGTPRYMSPEQASASGQVVDHRTDIYSLGATIYELLCGQPVFEAETPQAVITQILRQDPTPPRRLRPELSRDLETVVMKCLAREPSRRYQTAEDLARDLRAFLDGRDVLARRPNLLERAGRWLHYHRRTASVAGVAASLSVVLVVVLLVVAQALRAARLGYVELETSGPTLVARVVDDDHRPVVPEFSVPTVEPVAIPAGSYRLHVSAAGLPGETWPLDVQRGVTQSEDVSLRRRWLWPPMELRDDQYPELEIVELDGRGADLVLVTHQAPPGGRSLRRARRIDGASGHLLWTLDFDEGSLPADGDVQEWPSLLSHSGVVSGDRLLVRPPVDLDGDGVKDLVWTARTTSSLVAVSGEDGSILWWFRARPELPGDTRESGGSFRPGQRRGQTVGRPAVADVDGDGTADLIAIFASSGEKFVTAPGREVSTGPQSWIETVSGRDGQSIWRRSIDGEIFAHAYDSHTAEHGYRLARPRVGRVDDRDVVILLEGSRLRVLELATGKDAGSALSLEFEPRKAPRVVDLDGDGQSEVLLERFENPDGGVVYVDRSSRLNVLLTAVSPLAGGTLWERSYQPTANANALDEADRPWSLVEDLNGDGRPEIAVPSGDFGASSNVGQARVELLDGDSGDVRWASSLGAHPVSPPIAGPDIDADGWRDLFVSWIGHDRAENRAVLVVTSLSGRDGQLLWQWRRELSRGGRPANAAGVNLTFWHPGEDGWPLLLVPTRGARSGQPMTFVLSSGSGELVNTIGDIASLDVADLSGDGIGDLVYRVAPQGAPRLLVVPGTSPEPWRRLGMWRAASDFDSDGFTDLISAGAPLVVRSGRDGRRLFEVPEKTLKADEAFLAPPLPDGDFDGDKKPDLVFFDSATVPAGNGFTRAPTVAFYSSHEGQPLWLAGDIGLSQSSGSTSWRHFSWQLPALESVQLDGKRWAEVLVLQRGRQQVGEDGWFLRTLSGPGGQLLWQTPTLDGLIGLQPNPGPLWLEDLDSDGWRDLVLWVPVGSGGPSSDDFPCELQAVSGRDGRQLWRSGDVRVASHRDNILWRRVEGGDLDGDGRGEAVVAVTDGWDGDRRGYELKIIAVDTSSGEARWQWTCESGSADLLPPLVFDLDGNGKRYVAFGVATREGPRIVILDGKGELRDEIPLDLGRRNLEDTAHVWRHADVDGDGREELLWHSDGSLRAGRGPRDELWSWPLPEPVTPARFFVSGPPRITEVIGPGKGKSKRKGAAVVVLWSDTAVHGIDGATGRPIWRCEVPWPPATGMSNPPTLHRLSAGQDDASAPPRFLCQWLQYELDRDATAVRAAWPTTPEGEYAPSGGSAP